MIARPILAPGALMCAVLFLLAGGVTRSQGQATPTAPPAARKPGEAIQSAVVSVKGEVKPGAEVTVVVQFPIDAGFHVQANPPSEPNYIPAVLRLDPAEGVVSSPPKYPAGKEEPVVGLPKPLKIYEGSFEVLVPVRIRPDAKLPLTIHGQLTYQACRGATCYAPRKLKVEIPLQPK